MDVLIARKVNCCTMLLNSAKTKSEVAIADTNPRMRLGKSLISKNMHPTAASPAIVLASPTIKKITSVRNDRKSNSAPCVRYVIFLTFTRAVICVFYQVYIIMSNKIYILWLIRGFRHNF